jgi:TatD DNase family protein
VLIDAHAHFDMYEDRLDEALAEVERLGVLSLSCSMDPASYARNIDIAERSSFVVPLFGVHPWQAPAWAGRLDELGGLVERTPMVGEMGLDHRFIEDRSQYRAQSEVFEFLLSEAARLDRSVNLHTAGAEREILEALDRHGIERAIVHWYSGPLDLVDEMAERGFYFSMGVGATYHEHIGRVAAAIPEDRLLTETDNPGGPEWIDWPNTMPSLMRETLDVLAKMRGTTPVDIEATAERNFKRLVDSDPHLAAACGPLLGSQNN